MINIIDYPYKKLTIEHNNGLILIKLRSKDDEDYIKMNLEAASLLRLFLDKSVIIAERMTYNFKKNNMKTDKITDIGTVFGINGRMSVGVLPADCERIACILLGLHKENKDMSIVLKPKKAALMSLIISKIVADNYLKSI
ncbi:hypothetical protein J422_06977 [Methanocaldococcus villosus KIN24-T80]|uniref:Uncharacterized protein n=1 Tax=Methanocaldococcus villosus KIN24-T80 TaxID=1069083 RepID=N6VWX5_9EURY|nr:hypothetical protein [Methanocaldococcus villosus]ENN95597.1 hypothetical protein J422_06977 [Methanocaldococcus villosus KIN24-T80]